MAEHPHAAVLLAQWFKAEWPRYYAARSARDIEKDFGAADTLVAREGSELLGTVSLRAKALEGFPEFAPGLGGLYVAPAHRGSGVGTELVRAAMSAASGLGHPALYAATARAGTLFERLGWQALRTLRHDEAPIEIYRWRAAG